MNEAETRAEHIDPALAEAGWGVVEGSRIRREYPITLGRIEGRGKRGQALTAELHAWSVPFGSKVGTTQLRSCDSQEAWGRTASEGANRRPRTFVARAKGPAPCQGQGGLKVGVVTTFEDASQAHAGGSENTDPPGQ